MGAAGEQAGGQKEGPGDSPQPEERQGQEGTGALLACWGCSAVLAECYLPCVTEGAEVSRGRRRDIAVHYFLMRS